MGRRIVSHRFCIAPMIDWTDKHCRYFHRLLSQHALLYTEMITTGAILHGDRQRFLAFNPEEHPVALQLGGANPKALAECAHIGEDVGYDEINLNVGCPSDRVQSGKFGACLMAEPNLVGDCIADMQARTDIPVTVKTRIGIDDSAEKDFLWQFVDTVKQAGCQTFIIHARKAWLKGLSPKENREIPPLNYDLVYQLKKDFPMLEIVLNGGVKNLEEGLMHLSLTALPNIAVIPAHAGIHVNDRKMDSRVRGNDGHLDGIMLGRAAYQTPYLLSEVDEKLFGISNSKKSREQIIQELLPYIDAQLHQGTALPAITRHILGLWHGEPGARKIRQGLSNIHLPVQERIQLLKQLA